MQVNIPHMDGMGIATCRPINWTLKVCNSDGTLRSDAWAVWATRKFRFRLQGLGFDSKQGIWYHTQLKGASKRRKPKKKNITKSKHLSHLRGKKNSPRKTFRLSELAMSKLGEGIWQVLDRIRHGWTNWPRISVTSPWKFWSFCSCLCRCC